MNIEFKHRHTGRVLFSVEAESTKAAAEIAVANGVNLRYADLRYADLSRAKLSRAKLEGADLECADLRGTYLIPAGTPNGLTTVGWLRNGYLSIRVGCRDKRLADAREYWSDTHQRWAARQEIPLVLDYIEAVAKLRGWAIEKSSEVS